MTCNREMKLPHVEKIARSRKPAKLRPGEPFDLNEKFRDSHDFIESLQSGSRLQEVRVPHVEAAVVELCEDPVVLHDDGPTHGRAVWWRSSRQG